MSKHANHRRGHGVIQERTHSRYRGCPSHQRSINRRSWKRITGHQRRRRDQQVVADEMRLLDQETTDEQETAS